MVYREDPFQRIVNVGWGSKLKTFAGLYIKVTTGNNAVDPNASITVDNPFGDNQVLMNGFDGPGADCELTIDGSGNVVTVPYIVKTSDLASDVWIVRDRFQDPSGRFPGAYDAVMFMKLSDDMIVHASVTLLSGLSSLVQMVAFTTDSDNIPVGTELAFGGPVIGLTFDTNASVDMSHLSTGSGEYQFQVDFETQHITVTQQP